MDHFIYFILFSLHPGWGRWEQGAARGSIRKCCICCSVFSLSISSTEAPLRVTVFWESCHPVQRFSSWWAQLWVDYRGTAGQSTSFWLNISKKHSHCLAELVYISAFQPEFNLCSFKEDFVWMRYVSQESWAPFPFLLRLWCVPLGNTLTLSVSASPICKLETHIIILIIR